MIEKLKKSKIATVSMAVMIFLGCEYAILPVIKDHYDALNHRENVQVSVGGNTKILSFQRAKKILKDANIYNKDFYCECDLDKAETCIKGPQFDSRARRYEWEHLIPASKFGKTFREWKTGDNCSSARKCAGKVQEFSRMEGDLYNLKPVNGYVNQMRGNLEYTDNLFGADKLELTHCNFKTDGTVAVPRDEIKGDIGRVYLYFASVYPEHFRLSDAEAEQYIRWSVSDPVDEFEFTTSAKISTIQGNVNPYVYCDSLSEYDTKAYSTCIGDIIENQSIDSVPTGNKVVTLGEASSVLADKYLGNKGISQ